MTTSPSSGLDLRPCAKLVGLGIGAQWGAASGAIAHALKGCRCDFMAVTALHADRHAVLGGPGHVSSRRAVMGCSTTLDGRPLTAVSAVEADWDTPRLVARTRTACRFVQATNSIAAIGSVDDAARILRREAGTTMVQA